MLTPATASGPPRDVANTVLASYFLLGVGSLVMWNAFVTAFDFFQDEFGLAYPNLHFATLVSTVYNPCCLISLSLLMGVRHGMSDTFQIRIGLSGFIATLLGILFLNRFPSCLSVQTAFVATMAATGLSGMLTGVLQGALYSEASKLPLIYTQAIIAGAAASGFLVAVLRILTKLVLPSTSRGLSESAFAYFCVALAFTLLCFVIHSCVLPQSAFVRWHERKCAKLHSSEASSDTNTLHVPLLPRSDADPTSPGADSSNRHSGQIGAAVCHELDREPFLPGGEEAAGCNRQDEGFEPGGLGISTGPWLLEGEASHDGKLHALLNCEVESRNASKAGNALSMSGSVALDSVAPTATSRALSRADVLLSLWPSALAGFLIYMGTMTIFPGFLIAEATAHSALGNWAAVALITLFNFFDMASRFVPIPHSCVGPSSLVSVSLARVFCAFAVGRCSGVLLQTDAARAVVTVVFGATNGFLTSCAMLYGAKSIEGSPHASAGGNFLVLAIVAGVVVGSFLGWLVL